MSQPYSNLHTIFSEYIASNFGNREHFPELKLIPNDDALLPRIIKKTGEIQYSYRTEILFMLYNCGNFDLLINYYFCITSYINGKYPEAKILASNIRNFLKQESIVQPLIINYINNRTKLIYEILFVILHEIGHGLFFNSKEEKDYYIGLIDEGVKAMVNTYHNLFSNDIVQESVLSDEKYRSHLSKNNNIPDNYNWTWDNLFDSLGQFPSQIEKDKKKEELACDYFALTQFLYINEQLGMELDSCPDFFPACINALQFVQRHIWWDTFFIKQQSDKYGITSSIDQVRTIFIFTQCQLLLMEDYPEVYDYLIEESYNGIPMNQAEKDINFFEQNTELIREIGVGADRIDEQEKHETNELIIDAEDDILHIIENTEKAMQQINQ